MKRISTEYSLALGRVLLDNIDTLFDNYDNLGPISILESSGHY